MPGICGAFSELPEFDVRGVLDCMMRTLDHSIECRRGQHHEPSIPVALGRVAPNYAESSVEPVVLPEHEVIAVMDGELYDAAVHRDVLETGGCRFVGESDTEVIVRGYLAEGLPFFSRLTGKFSAAIYDGRQNQLLLVNDKFGMRPLYYSHVGERFLFSSEIKSLLAVDGVSRSFNIRGLAQFFTFGQLWCDDTLYDSIHTLPAAACLIWNCDSHRLTVQKYWRLQEPTGDLSRDPGAAFERLDEAFKRSVDRRVGGSTQHLGIALSGGLDARTVLGVIDHQQVDLDCFTVGMPGNRDSRSARQLAKIAGYRHHDLFLCEDFLAAFAGHLNRMVHLTDGHYLSQCIVMPTFPMYRDRGIRVLLRGHAGELMHMRKAYNFSLTPDVFALSGEQALNDWLFDHLRAYMLEYVDQPLFDFADAQEIDEFARVSLADSLSETSDWGSVINRISSLFVSQRTRRETAMSLVKFGSVAETRLPYVDEDVIESILALPARLRLGSDIQSAILRKRCPEFLRPANTNTGARVGAGKAMCAVHSARMKLFAKLGVRGYQPYERLGLWLRRELEPLVRSLLLDARCLDRGVFRAATVRHVVKEHMANKKNHTFLLLAMMIFEVGQRQFVDGQEVNSDPPGRGCPENDTKLGGVTSLSAGQK